MVEQTRQMAAETRNRIAHTREIVETSRRVYRRRLLLYRESGARLQRQVPRRSAAAESYVIAPQHRSPRAARLLRVLISSRIDDGRLPDDFPAVTLGAPGLGGECAACDGYMPVTRLVMAIPSGGVFVYLHADCYLIWRTQCHLRGVLRAWHSSR